MFHAQMIKRKVGFELPEARSAKFASGNFTFSVPSAPVSATRQDEGTISNSSHESTPSKLVAGGTTIDSTDSASASETDDSEETFWHSLRAIARAFKQVDRYMLEEIEDDIARFQDDPDYGEDVHIASRFETPDATTRLFIERVKAEKEGVVTASEAEEQSVKSKDEYEEAELQELVECLEDTTCLATWRSVFISLLVYQSSTPYSTDAPPWEEAKQRASTFQDLGVEIVDLCTGIKDELVSWEGTIGSAIEAKIKTLLLFDDIYARPTLWQDKEKLSPESHVLRKVFERHRRMMLRERNVLSSPSLESVISIAAVPVVVEPREGVAESQQEVSTYIS